MLSPLLVAAMEKIVHDHGLLAVLDAYGLAERHAREAAKRPRLQLRTCKCGRAVYAEDDFDFCEALNHPKE